MSGTKLFVANLAYQMTDAELEEFFSQAGTVVSAKIIRDHATGRSKGFGFVEMGSTEEAEEAMKLHDVEFQGRPLIVKEARPQEPRNNEE